jgi:hypothetical protein
MTSDRTDMTSRLLGAVACLAAISLAALLAAPWYESTVVFGGGEPNRIADANAWRSFAAFDIVILVGAAVALVGYWLREFMAAIAASAVVVIVIVYRLIDIPGSTEGIPDYTVGLAWGAWLSAATAVVLLAVCVIAERRKA